MQNRLIYFGAAASIIILFGLLYFFTDLISVNNQGNIAKQIETEKQIIPPMPKAQNQVDHGQKSGQTENEPEKVQTKTVGKNIEKQTTIAQQDKSKKEINENEIRTEPSEPETEKSISLQIAQSSDSLTDQMLSEQLMDNEDSDILHSTFSGVDLASNQPLEYYLGEVFIYGDQPDLSGYNNQIRSAAAGKRESKKTTGWLDADKKELIEPKDISVSADRKIAAEATGSKEADLNTVHFFTPVDRLPEFPGGIEKLTDFLNQHLNYPSEAKRQGIQGTVLVSFIIEKDGSIDNAKIIYGIGGGCNEAALLAIESMPRWQPALKNNEPQRVVFNIPITFKLK
ncbi:MAG: energy transducer TonB [Bacteroidales bacterium]|nr:energy transducer TonB [Bacteroidales bacterium]